MIPDAAALRRLEFHIRSPVPSPSTSSKPEPDRQGAPQKLDGQHASVDGQDNPLNMMNKVIFLMVRTPPLNLMNNFVPAVVCRSVLPVS